MVPASADKHEALFYRVLLFLAGLLIVPALVINLGSQAFIDDEGIRSLVAFEMLQSGDYIHTTINGEPYFKKPPLYNWILASGFSLTGTINEWTARLPTVLFLLLFIFGIYRSVYRATGDLQAGLIAAGLTLTCGRILFWDSFLGLIDICFSALIYANFMWLYFTFRRQKWASYFIGSWLITVLAFLLKGLPGLVFQALTLIGHLLWERQWKKLFHPAHFVGAGLFLLIIGGYYFLLLQGSDPAQVFGTLFKESAQRTPTHHDWKTTVGHLFAFPAEMTYHFLPWSILLVFIFPLHNLKERLTHPFIQFIVLVFAVNIPIYWISPQVYPRYLLMLAPLVFTTGYWLHRQANPTAWNAQYFRLLFLIVGVLLALLAWAPLFIPQTQSAAYLLPKTLFIAFLMSLCAWVLWTYRRLFFLALIVQLLVLRLAFDWFVIPDRIIHDTATAARADAIRVGKDYKDKTLYFLEHICLETTPSFYLATNRNQITKVWRQAPEPETAYLVSGDAQLVPGYQVLDTLRIRHFNDRTPYVLLISYPQPSE